jgi:murein DD-endopeptidase MepM/ murein hydrolase activator NlpD
MPRVLRPSCALALAAAAAGAALPSSASADGTGGAAASEAAPAIESADCGRQGQRSCAVGQTLTIRGARLADAEYVVFLGRRGRQDDRVVRPRSTARSRVTVKVPSAAQSGPVSVKAESGRRAPAGPRIRVRGAARSSAAPGAGAPGSDLVFPVLGRVDFGTATNRFGGGRGHGGQDVFADCGTPLVAVTAGTVAFARFQSRAGNYVVISGDDGRSYVYMHMLEPSPLRRGQRVAAGQAVGLVGETGRATGCHLHFELWTAPGWYEGGKAIDPLPELQAWRGR